MRLPTRRAIHFDFRYILKSSACKGCASRARCTSAKVNGRIIRHHAENIYVTANKERIEANPKLYKCQQAIVEHPYGTIKRQWGFDHIITKQSLNRASADVGLMMTAYNLRRIINPLGIDGLLSTLMLFISFFKGKNDLAFTIIPLNTLCAYLTRNLNYFSVHGK
ncbi:transposase [Carboxylicivirga mesophila]|uniref:Transposase n=1 Tax=Carboxylicivirga mesophila TaxID=1166478 RepID=A0ABS5KCR2_9BACT|nr:transposase [Carboxylicivirga mesophila]MBS2212719.1 transposase [Carboxylicivirga mesophila]